MTVPPVLVYLVLIDFNHCGWWRKKFGDGAKNCTVVCIGIDRGLKKRLSGAGGGPQDDTLWLWQTTDSFCRFPLFSSARHAEKCHEKNIVPVNFHFWLASAKFGILQLLGYTFTLLLGACLLGCFVTFVPWFLLWILSQILPRNLLGKLPRT